MKLYYYSKEKGHTSLQTDELIKKSLESHLGITKTAFKVKRTKLGKPYVDINDLYIGVTHTDTTVVVGIDSVPFGIDCECLSRQVKNHTKIAERYFSRKEQDYVNCDNVSHAERLKRFLEIWVKKEAYVKYLGTGIKDLKNCDTFSLSGCFELIKYGDNIIYIYKG